MQSQQGPLLKQVKSLKKRIGLIDPELPGQCFQATADEEQDVNPDQAMDEQVHKALVFGEMGFGVLLGEKEDAPEPQKTTRRKTKRPTQPEGAPAGSRGVKEKDVLKDTPESDEPKDTPHKGDKKGDDKDGRRPTTRTTGRSSQRPSLQQTADKEQEQDLDSDQASGEQCHEVNPEVQNLGFQTTAAEGRDSVPDEALGEQRQEMDPGGSSPAAAQPWAQCQELLEAQCRFALVDRGLDQAAYLNATVAFVQGSLASTPADVDLAGLLVRLEQVQNGVGFGKSSDVQFATALAKHLLRPQPATDDDVLRLLRGPAAHGLDGVAHGPAADGLRSPEDFKLLLLATSPSCVLTDLESIHRFFYEAVGYPSQLGVVEKFIYSSGGQEVVGIVDSSGREVPFVRPLLSSAIETGVMSCVTQLFHCIEEGLQLVGPPVERPAVARV